MFCNSWSWVSLSSSEAEGDPQVMTCIMSPSSGSSQMGQLECFRCCLLTMRTPVAAVLLSHLVMNVCVTRGATFRALPYAFQLIFESNRSGSICNFSPKCSMKHLCVMRSYSDF